MDLVPATLVVDSECQAFLVFGLEVPALVVHNAHLVAILWQVVIWWLLLYDLFNPACGF